MGRQIELCAPSNATSAGQARPQQRTQQGAVIGAIQVPLVAEDHALAVQRRLLARLFHLRQAEQVWVSPGPKAVMARGSLPRSASEPAKLNLAAQLNFHCQGR